jgi:hypothetical protein
LSVPEIDPPLSERESFEETCPVAETPDQLPDVGLDDEYEEEGEEEVWGES